MVNIRNLWHLLGMIISVYCYTNDDPQLNYAGAIMMVAVVGSYVFHRTIDRAKVKVKVKIKSKETKVSHVIVIKDKDDEKNKYTVETEFMSDDVESLFNLVHKYTVQDFWGKINDIEKFAEEMGVVFRSTSVQEVTEIEV